LAVVRRGANPTDNLSWYILKSTDGNYLVYNFGTTETDSPVQNDYDGDGKTDIGVARESDGAFYVLKSIDNGLLAVNWGFSTDLPITAYDSH